jgi:hypothetical protein
MIENAELFEVGENKKNKKQRRVEYIDTTPLPPPPPPPYIGNAADDIGIYNLVQLSKKSGKMRKDVLATGSYASCLKAVSKYQSHNAVIRVERVG